MYYTQLIEIIMNKLYFFNTKSRPEDDTLGVRPPPLLKVRVVVTTDHHPPTTDLPTDRRSLLVERGARRAAGSRHLLSTFTIFNFFHHDRLTIIINNSKMNDNLDDSFNEGLYI